MSWWLSRFLLLIGLLLFSGLFWWLPAALVQPALAITDTKPIRPDYYINYPHLTAMNTLGHPQFVLTAVRLVHFPRDKRTVLIKPHLIQYGTNTTTTTTAAKGYVSPNGHVLIMRGHVRVYRGATEKTGSAQVRTRTLTVHLIQ